MDGEEPGGWAVAGVLTLVCVVFLVGMLHFRHDRDEYRDKWLSTTEGLLEEAGFDVPDERTSDWNAGYREGRRRAEAEYENFIDEMEDRYREARGHLGLSLDEYMQGITCSYPPGGAIIECVHPASGHRRIIPLTAGG